MQELRESFVSIQSSPVQSPICSADKLSSQDQDPSTFSFKEHILKAAPAVKNTDDVLQHQDDGVVPDTSTEVTSSDITSDQETELCFLSAIDMSTGSKGLRRCATFPCTEGELTVTKSISSHGEPVMEPSTYERSKSLPFQTHLKSAMKGSRAQQPGALSRSADLHVKWAPDVYDPPVTSQSHTVQSHSGRKGGGGGSSSKGKKKNKKKDKRKNKG